MRWRVLGMLGMTIALAACMSSSRRSRSASGAGGGSDLICREEVPTGTSLSRQVCRTPEQMEDDRMRAEQMLRQPGRQQQR